jgi:hypothetical protein
MSTRRVFLQGFAASATTTAVIAAGIGSASEREIMRYEQGIATQFKQGNAELSLLAMAHLAGFSSRLPAWLSSARQADSEQDWDGLQRLFEVLLTGDAASIEAAVRATQPRNLGFVISLHLKDIDRASPKWLQVALTCVVDALTLLDRGDVISALHGKSLERLGPGQESSLTGTAALALAQAADWPHAVEILEEARRMRVDIPVAFHEETLLWKYAYLHGEIERVMPVLAQAPLRTDLPHLVEGRAWEFKAYQIRAGKSGVEVPVIEHDQPHGYEKAAAMQVAALEDDPAAADLVQKLRRVLRPKSVEMILADYCIRAVHDMVESALSKARAAIAAKRKNYGRAAELARTPVQDILVDPASDVINAFLDEGDWRAAADIAKDNDPRRKAVIDGLDDTRIDEYVDLSERLAVAAAWSGDDGAAAEFHAAAEDADRANPDKDPDYGDPDRFARLQTMLAGAAEGLLPRRYLNVVTRGFLWPI